MRKIFRKIPIILGLVSIFQGGQAQGVYSGEPVDGSDGEAVGQDTASDCSIFNRT